MLKRDRLKAMLRKTTDKQFDAIWRETYGYVLTCPRFLYQGL